MASVTLNPSAGDGYIVSYNASWASARSGSNLAAIYNATLPYGIYLDGGNVPVDATYYNYVGFLPFNLASIAAGSTITAATLRLYVTGKDASQGGNLYVVGSSQASLTILATTDFSTRGSTSFGTTTPAFSSLTNNTFLEIALNASGLAALTPGGSGLLALRHSCDFNNTTPTQGSFAYKADAFTFNSSEDSSNKAELVVTYTPPPSGSTRRRRRPSGLYTR